MAGLWHPFVTPVAWYMRSPGRLSNRCNARHHQQRWKRSLFESSTCPRHNPRCTALIILKEGTRVPMSWPGALGDREKNPGCPFTINAHARQKSKEYCRHVPIKGDTASPDWIPSAFSSGLSSLQVRERIKNSPILSQKVTANLEASSLNSSSLTEPGELLNRSDQAFQLKSGGWADRKITMSPALSSECGSVTKSAPCPILVLQTRCCVYTTCGSVRKRAKARSGCAWGIPPSEGAARTKVPAQVGCTWCSPVVAEMGKSSSSVFSLWGPMSLRRLCHHLAAAGQWGREGSCRLWFAKSRLSTMTYTVWNSTRYPHWRKTYSKINSQWGCPISSPVTSYSNGAVAPNLAPGSPATNRALVSKLPLPWESPGRSVRSLSQSCWKSTFLGPGVRGVSAGIRVRPFPTCRHPPWEAWPGAGAPNARTFYKTEIGKKELVREIAWNLNK